MIGLKVAQAAQQQQYQKQRKQDAILGSPTRRAAPTVASTPVTANRSASSLSSTWRVFLEGTFLYVGALTLPTLIGVSVQFFWEHASKSSSSSSSGMYESNEAASKTYFQSFCHQLESYVGSEYTGYLYCEPSSNFSAEKGSAAFSTFAKDQETNDWTEIAMWSLLFAAIRFFLLAWVTRGEKSPFQDSTNQYHTTMARNYSWHLLASDYSVSPATSPSISSKPTLSSSNMDAKRLVDQLERLYQEESGSEVSSDPESSAKRLRDGPRYATALFRLLFCTLSCALAVHYFVDADFWPVYVGGHGTTKRCWDLSGGLTMGLDADFDHRNAHLKQYFLLQASYHWQSGTFHAFSMVLTRFVHSNQENLWSSSEGRGFVRQATFRQYLKSLGHHTIGLLFIGTAYIFSSLRRLTAIGMFAFDVSSWFLHVLQIAFTRKWSKRKVLWLHRYLVIPSFVYARFYVWPILWYSAIKESQNWFSQLENMLVPGSSLAIQALLNTVMVITMAMAIVYFKRLVKHPHLKRLKSL